MTVGYGWFQLPVIFLIAALAVLAGRFVLSRTVFGRLIYAIGNNEEAVRLSGHNSSPGRW
jgi:ribose transport system permease protein